MTEEYLEIINISGESREYRDLKNGIIYVFPYPAPAPTKVPKELALKLLRSKKIFKQEKVKGDKQ